MMTRFRAVTDDGKTMTILDPRNRTSEQIKATINKQIGEGRIIKVVDMSRRTEILSDKTGG